MTQPINNFVIVSGEQRRDSAIHVHVFHLPQTPLPSRLPRNIEQSSLCCKIYPSSLFFREGNGTPLQYSCLENPTGRGAWWAAVHGVVKSWIRLSDFTFTFMHWRRKWEPTPVFLPGGSQGRGSLVDCRLWGRTESATTEAT